MGFTLPTVLKGLGIASAVSVTATGIVFKDEIYETVSGDINYSKRLNIPKKCLILKNDSDAGCQLNKEELEGIKFLGKSGSEETTTNAAATLKIKRTTDKEPFDGGLKFIFETTVDTTINLKGNPQKTISLKRGANTEFKIKIDKNNYSLENAWTQDSLAAKVGLKKQGNEANKYVFNTGTKVNAYLTDSNYVFEATLGDSENTKVVVAQEHADHNQGFKFTVESDINLTGGGNPTSGEGISKLTQTGKTYSIEYKKIANKEGWYFVEKSSSSTG